MANNSNSSSSCDLSLSYIQTKNDAYFFVFYILTPIYFVVAFIGHILCLVGFVKRAKIEPTYSYQIYICMAKLLEIVFFTIFVITYKWLSGIESQGVKWYKENYYLMWYAAHESTPMSNSCISTSLFMAVAMTGDRLFAMWKPFVYRNINAKRHQAIAVCVCFLLGWSTSIFDWFRYELISGDNIYVAVVNSGYVGGILGITLANIRNAFRAGAVLALVVGNIILVRLFSRHCKVKPIAAAGAGAGAGAKRKSIIEIEKQAKRKSSEQNLLIIVVAQSILTSVVIFLFVTYYVLSYADPAFIFCKGVMFASVMDGTLEISDMIIFVVVVAVDKKVRKAILAAITRKKSMVEIMADQMQMQIQMKRSAADMELTISSNMNYSRRMSQMTVNGVAPVD